MNIEGTKFVGSLCEANAYLEICHDAVDKSLGEAEIARREVLQIQADYKTAFAKLDEARKLSPTVDGQTTQQMSLTQDVKTAMEKWIVALVVQHDRDGEHYITRVLKRAAYFNIVYTKFKDLTSDFMRDPDNKDSSEIDHQAALVTFMRKNLLHYLQNSTINLNPSFAKIKMELIVMLQAAAPADAETHYKDTTLAAWSKIE